MGPARRGEDTPWWRLLVFDYFHSLEEQNKHQHEAEIVRVCFSERNVDTFQKNTSQNSNDAMKHYCYHRIHPERLYVYMTFVSIP
jgi:hypothetical protein